jgi:hypothetical protein
MGGKTSVMQVVEERDSLKIQVLDLLEELAKVKHEREIIQRHCDMICVDQMNSIIERRRQSLEYYRREFVLKQKLTEHLT